MRKCAVCWNDQQRQRSVEKRSTVQGTLEYILKRSKAVSKMKHLSFNLDIEYLIELYNKQNGECAISKEKMEYES